MADEINFLPDDTLLMTFIAGEATPAEAMLIDQWIAASPDHLNMYEQLTRLWLATEGFTINHEQGDSSPIH